MTWICGGFIQCLDLLKKPKLILSSAIFHSDRKQWHDFPRSNQTRKLPGNWEAPSSHKTKNYRLVLHSEVGDLGSSGLQLPHAKGPLTHPSRKREIPDGDFPPWRLPCPPLNGHRWEGDWQGCPSTEIPTGEPKPSVPWDLEFSEFTSHWVQLSVEQHSSPSLWWGKSVIHNHQ